MKIKNLNRFFHRAPASEVITKIIVGLGNPGSEYSRNRHNVGFMCVNRLARDIGARFDKKEGLARTAHGSIGGIRVILARPQTYMNLSGRAVTGLLGKYRLSMGNLIVIHDDIDLRLGKLKIKQGGRSAGHHGVESIICSLDGEDFIRVRIGVGRPELDSKAERQSAVVDFVLDDFSETEARVLEEALPRAVEAVKTILTEGVEAAMNKYNRSPKAPPDEAEPI